MKIPIGKYLITSDENNIILNKVGVKGEKAKNPGEERLVLLGYYSNLTQCIQGLLDEASRASEATSAQELLKEIAGIKASIRKALKGLEWEG